MSNDDPYYRKNSLQVGRCKHCKNKLHQIRNPETQEYEYERCFCQSVLTMNICARVVRINHWSISLHRTDFVTITCDAIEYKEQVTVANLFSKLVLLEERLKEL